MLLRGFHMRSSMWWWDSTCTNCKLTDFLFWIRDYCALGRLKAHYAALALFTWNMDQARGTKAMMIFFFFSWGIKAEVWGHHEIPTLPISTLQWRFIQTKGLKQYLQFQQSWLGSKLLRQCISTFPFSTKSLQEIYQCIIDADSLSGGSTGESRLRVMGALAPVATPSPNLSK